MNFQRLRVLTAGAIWCASYNTLDIREEKKHLLEEEQEVPEIFERVLDAHQSTFVRNQHFMKMNHYTFRYS